MAVTLLKHYERFAGLSTDVKPANAPMGSTFFEWDTSKLYTLSPAGWVEKKGAIHGDVQLVDDDGNELAILANGKLPVDLTLTGDTSLAANVAVQDGTDSGKKLKVNTDGSVAVQLSGSRVDLRGLAANKPLATAVGAGTTYWSVDTDPNADAVEVSDSTNWTVMA